MRESRAPALVGSALLHALVLGAGLITLPLLSKPVEMAASVPITIVSQAPPEPPTAAEAAPVPTPETTPEPAPTPAPAAPPPPKPAPRPTPKPLPEPAPKPAPAPPKPAPAAPAPKKAESKPLDLSALAASLPQSKPQPGKAAAKPASRPLDLSALAASLPRGAKGPAHVAAAPVVNPGPPRPLTGDEMGAVTAKLMRLWNPNCGVEGVGKVVVRVEMHLEPDGRLARPPELLDRPIVEAGGPILAASAQRALTAASRGEPYTELPRDRYPAWKDIIVRFNAKEACAGQ